MEPDCSSSCRRRSRRLAGLTPENGGPSSSTTSPSTSSASRSHLSGHAGVDQGPGPSSIVTRSSQAIPATPLASSSDLAQTAHNQVPHNSANMGLSIRPGSSDLGACSFDFETTSNSSTTSAASTETLPLEATDTSNGINAPSTSGISRSAMPAAEQEPSSSTESENSGRTERRRRPRWRARGSYLLGHVGGMRGPVPVRGQSYCDCPKESRDIECRCGEDDSIFEWVWDKSCKSAATDLSDNTRDVRFHINYSSGTAAIRGSKPLMDRQHFWEIKMTTPVYGTDMMVGVGTYSVDMDAYRHNFCSLLGKDGESWGLSYYGRLQHKGRFQTLSGSRYGQGSIIGVHLDMWHGTLGFYKNRRPLGIAYRGLAGKKLYPMVSSTAARTGMRIIRACSFSTSLQFLCCQVLRRMVPHHLDVTDALAMPPGLQAFLQNNLSWLLRPSELSQVMMYRHKRTRSHSQSESSEDETDKEPVKRPRTRVSSDDESQ